MRLGAPADLPKLTGLVGKFVIATATVSDPMVPVTKSRVLFRPIRF